MTNIGWPKENVETGMCDKNTGFKKLVFINAGIPNPAKILSNI